MIAPARVSAETVRAALDVLHPDGVVIEARIPKTRRGTVSGYFDDKDRLVKAIAPHDGTANIYLTLNPVNPDLMARANNRLKEYVETTTSDKDILSRHWLPIDLDPVRPKDISSTDAELAAAIAKRDAIVSYLCNEGGYPEMVLANSGNGAHALIRCTFPNTPDIASLFERTLKALAARFDDAHVKLDPGVFNAARIWKLYGTLACKGDPIDTRPHRRAEITSAPETPALLTREQLEWLADQAPAPVTRTYSAPSGQRHPERDMLAEFQGRGLYLRALAPPKHAVTCPWQSEHSIESGVSETCIFEPDTPGEPWGFDCKHSHCTERTIKDVLALFRDGDKPQDPLAPLSSLSENPPLDLVEAALRGVASNLNGTDKLKRAIVRESAIKRLQQLKVAVAAPAKLVDTALGGAESEQRDRQGTEMTFTDPVPWPDPVDGVALVTELVRTIKRFVAMSPEAADAVALWILNTHAHDAGEVSPLLGITSPERRCGKTTLLRVIKALVPRPLLTSNITPSALFRTIETHRPSLLVDEVDTFLTLSDELRGALNSGHTRDAYFVRNVGDEHEARCFSTWAPKAVALIGRLPVTVQDRSIVLQMARRAKGETIERFRVRVEKDLSPLCRQAARWAKENTGALALADPEVPDELDDRAADNWRPLLAIADLAGGDWPARARTAAKTLSSIETRGDSEIGVLLLADLREMFEKRNVDRLASADIVKDLIALDERPWGDWRHGKPLTARHLARLLEPFGIKPEGIRIGETTPRGYRLSNGLRDAFARYLPSEVQHPQQFNNNEDLDHNSIRNKTPHVAHAKPDLSMREQRIVADVADRNPENGGDGDKVGSAYSVEDLSL